MVFNSATIIASQWSMDLCIDSAVTVSTGGPSCLLNIKLFDQQGDMVASGTESSGVLAVKEAKLWWPFTTVEKLSDEGYLYNFEVQNQ